MEIKAGYTVIFKKEVNRKDAPMYTVLYTDGTHCVLASPHKYTLVCDNKELCVFIGDKGKPYKRGLSYEKEDKVVFLSDILDKSVTYPVLYEYGKIPLSSSLEDSNLDIIPYEKGCIKNILTSLDLKGYTKIVSNSKGEVVENVSYVEDESSCDNVYVRYEDKDDKQTVDWSGGGVSYNINEVEGEPRESIKNDFKDDKLRWDLLPLEEIEDIVKVYHEGAKKYGENRWQKLPNGKNRYKAALLRHLMEYEKGNRIDEETGAWHLAQCAWNAIAMLYLDKHEHNK